MRKNLNKLILTGSLLLILVFSSVVLLWYNSQPTVGDNSELEIKITKYSFEPNKIVIQKDSKVEIKVVSLDIKHGFAIDEYDINVEIDPFNSQIIEIVTDKTGKFKIKCSVPCGNFHPYMIGELKVVPNTTFNFSILLVTLIASIFLLRIFADVGSQEFIELPQRDD